MSKRGVRIILGIFLLCLGSWAGVEAFWALAERIGTIGSASLAVTIGVAFGLLCFRSPKAAVKHRHRRGARELTFLEAECAAKELSKRYGEGPFFGLVELPFTSKDGHFAVIGATGSGKTVTIRLFLQKIVPELSKGKLQGRALIYDAKQDMLPILASLGAMVPIHILNPFDKRSSAWNMAADITEPATAYQLASLIISEGEKGDGNSMFFTNTMRNIMSSVIQSFMEFSPGIWTFRDVLLGMATEDNLRAVLCRTVKGRQVLEASLRQGETFDNIRASIEARISEYEIIAALWDSNCGKQFSIRDWLKSRSIVVLGNREASRKVMDTLNALLFNRVVELINDGPETRDETTWIVLDEVRRAGKLDKLKDLLLFGRSKGASVLLGLQDVEGLREVYGNNVANEILGQCANKAVLWLNSPETAKWASTLFGEEEMIDIQLSRSRNESGLFSSQGNFSMGQNLSESVHKRELVLPSEFLAKSGLFGDGGIGGFYSLQHIGDFKARVGKDWIQEELVAKEALTEPLLERSSKDQVLRPWDEVDFARLRLSMVRVGQKAALSVTREPSLSVV